MSPECVVAHLGAFAFRGQVVMPAADPSDLLSTMESAKFAGVAPVTIRQWRRRGWLAPQGLDERGYPMHSREALRAAEQLVRGHGLEASGVDPRRLRRPRAALGFSPCLFSTSSSPLSRTRSSWRYSGRLPPTSFARLPCSAGCRTRMAGSARCRDRPDLLEWWSRIRPLTC